MDQSKILLESGTNEVEILEFYLGEQAFGVNVLKIQAIEQFDPARLTTIHLAPPSVMGSLLFRNECLTLIDLRVCLDTGDPRNLPAAQGEDDEDGETPQPLVMVLEFNDRRTAFLVDGVDRIHRVGWDSITPLSPYLNQPDTKFTGSLNINDREIMLVDLEKVVAEVLPGELAALAVPEETSEEMRALRGGRLIFLADDSPTVREMLLGELAHGGYTNVQLFSNGRECLEAVKALAAEAEEKDLALEGLLGGLITDIEMPSMDGLALCRTIRQDLGLADLPVIVFSSLINAQIARKCEQVGATDYISKPQFSSLVRYLDRYVLMREDALV